MPGVDFACPFPAAQLSVLKRLRRLDLSNSRISGKCAPGPAAPRAMAARRQGMSSLRVKRRALFLLRRPMCGIGA